MMSMIPKGSEFCHQQTGVRRRVAFDFPAFAAYSLIPRSPLRILPPHSQAPHWRSVTP
jgi:hypothetical protein